MGEKIRQIFLLPVKRPRGSRNRKICTSATELYSGSSDEWPGTVWPVETELEGVLAGVVGAGVGATGSRGTTRFFVTEQPVRTRQSSRRGPTSQTVRRGMADDHADNGSLETVAGGRVGYAKSLFINSMIGDLDGYANAWGQS